MDLDKIQDIVEQEREESRLQEIEPGLYEEVATHIDELRSKRQQKVNVVDNPWRNREIRELTDEIDTMRELASELYELRTGKIAREAGLLAGGYDITVNTSTEQEQDLLGSFRELIEQHEDDIKRWDN